MAGSSTVSYAAIAIAAVAVALSVASLAAAGFQAAPAGTSVAPEEEEEGEGPATREFYLFSEVEKTIDQEKLGIPPDMFSLEEMTVRKGDRVVVHFYNLEPEESEELHSFSMFGPYEMHNDVQAGGNKTIEFVADTVGIFEYQCVYHMPTMKGNLIVLPPQ